MDSFPEGVLEPLTASPMASDAVGSAPADPTSSDRKASMQRQFEALEIAANVVQNNRLLLYSVKTKRQFNDAFIRIFGLPPELLIAILAKDLQGRIAPEDSGKPESPPVIRQQQLAQVCCLWRDIVLQTPQLWTDVRHELGDGALAFRLSRGLPLSISCCSMAQDTYETRDVEFLKQLKLQMHRVRSLKTKVHGVQTSSVAQLLLGSTPILESLHFDFDVDFPSSLSTYLILDLPSVASLRHVNLNNVSLKWDHLHLPLLRSLQLVQVRSPPTGRQLVDLLKGTPDLETLVLCELPKSIADPASQKTLYSRGDDSVVLPNLWCLGLHDVRQDILDYLYPNLQTPILDTLSLHYVLPDQLQTSGLDAHVYRMAKQALTPDGRIRISYFNQVTLWGFSNSHPGRHFLHLEFIRSDIRTLIPFVEAIMPPRGTLELRVGQVPYSSTPFDVHDLDLLPGLLRIDVEDSAPLAVEILQYLQERRSDDQGWPCPQLRHIDLSKLRQSDELRDAIAQFEARRYGSGGKEGALLLIAWALPEGLAEGAQN